jgi:uncharacterized protein YutE (UPF0331/DUF86 family)
MLNEADKDKLNQTVKSININFERLNFALNKTEPLLPITIEKYNNIQPENISYIDQFIFRFSKIQDLMAEKLFRLVLIAVEEDIESKSFLTILDKLEQLNVLNNKNEWIYLRKLRNEVSHEYPLLDEDALTALNKLLEAHTTLAKVYSGCLDFLKSHDFQT